MPTNPRPSLPLRNALRVVPLLCAALFGGTLALPRVAQAQIAPIEDLDAFPSGPLQITDGKKLKLDFTVWLADSPSRQAQGLMFVRGLPDLRGMLFVYGKPREISMWMKNTYIPLDMVFIGPHGRVQQVIANATPHSLDIIKSDKPAVAILEIAGGEAARLGIRAGQQVRHSALDAH
jgi:uncharacterized membrane protein (UPF0127 family)